MATTATVPAEQVQSRTGATWLGVALLAAGLLLRLRLAWATFLNPDEALHYFLSRQASLKLAYEASLTTAHPPLMILFLHYWSRLGSSEFVLRLPFVLAGTLFCWIMFLWMRRVTNSRAAWFGLALFLFAPPLISLSAEIRQYALLLLFCASALYLLERALSENSGKWMALSAATLYLALFTHYSTLIFAAAIGVYGLIRLLQRSHPAKLMVTWMATQLGGLGICAFLFESQISKLRHSGVPSEIAATWLRGSIFHRGEDHIASFAWTRTLRLFRYFFSHGTIGVLGFLLFVFAIVAMFWPDRQREERFALGLLLILPFLITLGAAFAGIYPYGGTRHDVFLVTFAIAAISIGLDRLPLPQSRWIKPALVAAALIICSLFPSPSGPYITPANQQRELMRQAISYLGALPPSSTIFTDQQGSMVLNYYFCAEQMPLTFSEQSKLLLRMPCGEYYVLTAGNTQTGFDRQTFPVVLGDAWQSEPKEQRLYVFQSGWINDKEQDWLTELRRLGGDPRNFGPNLLVCPITRTTAQSGS